MCAHLGSGANALCCDMATCVFDGIDCEPDAGPPPPSVPCGDESGQGAPFYAAINIPGSCSDSSVYAEVVDAAECQTAIHYLNVQLGAGSCSDELPEVVEVDNSFRNPGCTTACFSTYSGHFCEQFNTNPQGVHSNPSADDRQICRVNTTAWEEAQASSIDECATGTHNCDTNAVCADELIGFTCTCNPGFEGTGTACTDVDECDLGMDSCYDDATCTNTPGGYSCTGGSLPSYIAIDIPGSCTAAGYIDVADIDECKTALDHVNTQPNTFRFYDPTEPVDAVSRSVQNAGCVSQCFSASFGYFCNSFNSNSEGVAIGGSSQQHHQICRFDNTGPAGGVLPPPPPPVVVEIAIVTYTPEEETTAAAELSTALATLTPSPAAEGTPPPPVVEIAATVGFAISIATIAEGSQARTDFEEGFRASMAGSIGGGVAVTPERIIIDAITTSRRRLLDTETEPETDHRRTQWSVSGTVTGAIDVDFHIVVPVSVAIQATSLVAAVDSSAIVVSACTSTGIECSDGVCGRVCREQGVRTCLSQCLSDCLSLSLSLCYGYLRYCQCQPNLDARGDRRAGRRLCRSVGRLRRKL